jgi:anti-anti-sigma factor
MALAIAVTGRGTTTIVELDGEWDLAARDTTRTAIGDALSRHPRCVVLDLSQVSFIDASGVHVIAELARRAAAERISLVIAPGPPAVQRVFALCHPIGDLPFAADGSPRPRPTSRLSISGASFRHQRRRSHDSLPGDRRRAH